MNQKSVQTVTADKFVLRFDTTGLREKLKARAASNRRSLNAELLSLIERGLRAEGGENGAAD